jgi:hypothetical protein
MGVSRDPVGQLVFGQLGNALVAVDIRVVADQAKRVRGPQLDEADIGPVRPPRAIEGPWSDGSW